MADSIGNSTTSAGTLLIGSQVASDIEESADTDWFRVALDGGTTYRFDLRGNSPFLKLLDADGHELSSRVETRDGIASLTFTPLLSGDHYLEVGGRRQVLNYTLQAAVAPIQDDFRDDVATTARVAIGEQVLGNIEVAQDHDWFRVALESETTYWFDVRGIVGGEWTRDSLVVNLMDASGADLRISTRSDATGVALMAFTPLVAGEYHVVVRKDGDTVDGSYALQAAVAPIQDDFRNDSATLGVLAIGAQVSGAIEVPMDVDWFRMEFEAGQTYLFEVPGINADGTAHHGRLDIMRADGGAIGPTSHGGTDANPVYSHTAITSGTYFLAVRNAGETGTYSLAASVDPYPRNFVGGTAANEVFYLTGAVDVIVGAEGVDTVKIDASRSDYMVAKDGNVLVAGPTGQQSDFLYGIERVQFNDRALAFDIGFDGNAGKVVRSISVLFGASAPEMPAFIGTSLNLLDHGMGFDDFMQHNLDAVLGTHATSEEIVTLLYKNVTSRDPPAQAMEFYSALLDDGIFTPGQLAVFAANTVENAFNVIRYVGIKGTTVSYSDYAVL